MLVTELLNKGEVLHGQSIQLQGRLIAIFERGTYFTFLCASNRLRRTNYVRIQQPFAEIRRIIQPMSLHLLRLERGYMIEKPYLYNFPVSLRATSLYDQEEERPILQDISAVHLRIPYPQRLRSLVDAPEWEYQAEVEYAPLTNLQEAPPYRATIRYRRHLHFAPTRPDVQVLNGGETRYARQLLKKTLRVPGWLTFSRPRSLFETDSIRASLLPRPAQGSAIWMPDGPQERVVKICGGLNPLQNEAPVVATVTGKIRYVSADDDDAPNGAARLAFSRVYSIELSGEARLRHRHPKPQIL